MLELRSACECCGAALPPDAEALICSFECTWCPACAAGFPEGACPNCGGELVRRPVRPDRLLATNPPSTRVVRREDCTAG